MIVKQIRGDVFNAIQRHIAFAVNTQGYNDAGFAGQVSTQIWPALANTGGNKLGEVLAHQSGSKTYYALVCHSLEAGGWKETPRTVLECLDKIVIPESEEIATVLMGSGVIGVWQGADVKAILAALDQSLKKVVVYSL